MVSPSHNISLRALAAEELVEASRVVQASGLGTSFEELARYAALPTTGLIAACWNTDLVGVAGAVTYGSIGVIGPMSVEPDVQGHGVGTALLDSAIRWLSDRDVKIITLDATAAGAPLYRRKGFATDYYTVHFARLPSSSPCQSRLDQAERVAPVDRHELTELDTFDAKAFGASRRAVLESYLADFADRSLAVRLGGRIVAYAIAQRHRIGPFVANDAASAADVAIAVADMPFPDGALVSVPDINETAAMIYECCGFVVERKLERMRLGGLGPPGDPQKMFGVTSYALG